MIEINLLPGAERRSKKARGGFSLKLPSGPEFDRITVYSAVVWILGPVIGLWLFLGIRAERADVQVALDQAVADSARYAQLIATQRSLRARQDTIAQKLSLIQEIDAGRYVWPHLMDEISRALPPYTWLEAVDQLGGGTTPSFQIEGRTGNLAALTRYMDALESSPFIRNIELITSEQARISASDQAVVNNFVLSGVYEAPPVEMVETVPLFPDDEMNTAMGSEVSNGSVGTP